MNRDVLRVAGYRFRTTFRRQRAGYLALVLLVGLVGGLALAAVAAARRTESSYPAFFASTNPSDLRVGTANFDPGSGMPGFDPALLERIRHLPHVRSVASQGSLQELQLGPDGAPLSMNGVNVSYMSGSIDGEFVTQDRMTAVAGRLADPNKPGEAELSVDAAAGSGLGVGSVIPIGIYTNAQTVQPGFGTASVPPTARATVTVVGLVKVNDQVLTDDADAGSTQLLFTPALIRPYLDCCVGGTQTGIRVDDPRNVPAVQAELAGLLGPGYPPAVPTGPIVAKVERAIKPESIALGVFGGIAALAALIIAGQVIGRQIRLGAGDAAVLRALGAGPWMTAAEALVGTVGGVVAGSLLAGAVAIALSPLAPIGPVRPVYPTPGVAVDWTVIGLGTLALIVALAVITLALALRAAPQRADARPTASDPGSVLARAAAGSGLPAPAVAGIRFALEPGRGRTTVPVRSALIGAVLATMVVVATVTFGGSLHTLVSHPALYGWNWDYDLSPGGAAAIPEQKATTLLGADHDVAAWSGYYFSGLLIGGQNVPVLGGTPGAPVQPPVLSGHGLDAPGQLVLGATTLAQLHRRIGESVAVSDGADPPTELTIVGTATMPAIGAPGSEHLEMGVGALLSSDLIPAGAKNPFNNPDPGPMAIFVRLRAGANPARARDALGTIAGSLSDTANGGVSLETVLRPAEIINYRSMGTTPGLLASALAAGAVVALGLTLLASVRRRRRDLALFKTLGFTRRQLSAVIAWQSTVAVGIGTALGVPLGVAAGRSLWDLFAGEIHVVPHPAVPVAALLLIAAGGVVLANVVAAVPGRIAARTPTALVLRDG